MCFVLFIEVLWNCSVQLFLHLGSFLQDIDGHPGNKSEPIAL